jgi:acetyltransferase EpsM
MLDIVIIGAGGHSKVVADAAIRAGFRVLGFLDDHATVAPLLGYDVIGTVVDFVHNLELRKDLLAVVAIGDNRARMHVVEKLGLPRERYTRVIDPSAVVSRHASIAEGTVVLQGAIVNPGTVVGQHVILNTGCTIDHDCKIGSYAHISPGVNLAGGVTVGEGTHLGIGSCVIPGCSVGDWSVVGAGAAVVKSLRADCVAVGVPARVIQPVTE